MAFNPDKYLADKAEQNQPSKGFNPDAYLSKQNRKPESAPQDDSTLRTLLDAGRGAVKSSTFGFNDEIAGALGAGKDLLTGNTSLGKLGESYTKHRDETRALDKEAEERSPIASTVGGLVGGIAPAIGAGLLTGGVGGVATEASGVARLLNALKVGAAGGALAGAGNADSLSDVPKDVIEGAAGGAATGGLLHGAIGAAKMLGKGTVAIGKSVGNTTTYNDLKDSLSRRLNGESVVGRTGLDNAEKGVRSAAEKTAFGAKGALESAGSEIGAAQKLAAEKGINVNAKDGVDQLKDFIENAKTSIDDRDRTDATKLQKLLDNLEQGVEQKVDVNYKKITPSKTITTEGTPATPSSKEKLELELAKENANRKVLGQPELDATYTNSNDDKGNNLLTQLKTAQEQTGASERAIPQFDEEGNILGHALDQGDTPSNYNNIAKPKTVLDTPGTPQQLSSESIIPGKTENVSETLKGRLGGSDPANLSMEEAQKLKDVLNTQNGVGQSTPELSGQDAINLTKQVAGNLDENMRSFEPLATANDKYANAKEAFKTLGLAPDAFKGDRLTAAGQQQLVNNIRRMAADTASGENASYKLTQALDLLQKADPKIADQLRPMVENASRSLDLAQKASRLGLLNKSTWVGPGAVHTGNAIGAVAQKISQNTPQYFKEVAQKLMATGTPGAMKVAQGLAEGIKKDNQGRNAILFSLQQNPTYREMLKDHFKDESK